MSSYTSEQLKALLAGQLSPEQESEMARDIESHPELLNRLERLSGSGIWTIGSAPLPDDTDSPNLEGIIERVVLEASVERIPGSHPQGVTDHSPNPHEPISDYLTRETLAVPGIRIVREIGRGGMGVVYEGWDEHVGRKVAIKRLHPMRRSNSDAKERLLQEARAAGSLLHPNIVSVYGVHFQDDMPILVQQFVEGETLQDRINSERFLNWEECLDFAMQIASGLEAAHAAGIVHRDLKPDNILIEKNSHIVRIADFGIAKQSTSSGLTTSDRVAGTPAYMSPEQTSGGNVDARSDLFSLGSVLVAAVTGTPPFGLDDPFVVMDRIRTQDARSLRSIRNDIPSWLCNIIDCLLIKERSKRIQSAAELTAALMRQAQSTNSQVIGSRTWLSILAIATCASTIVALPFLLPTKEGKALKDKSITTSDNSNAVGEFSQKQESIATKQSDFVPTKPIWIRRNSSEFESLSDAIASAEDGDTIEIGNDMECSPVVIQSKSLTLKGASQKRPVLRPAEENELKGQTEAYFIRSNADLRLERIEIDWQTKVQAPFFDERVLNAVVGSAPGTRMVMRDCKISRSEGGVCVAAGGNLDMQHTTIGGSNIALAWFGNHSRATIENCVLDGRIGVAIIYPLANVAVFSQSDLKIKHTTLRTGDAFSAMLSRRPEKPVRVVVEDSIFDTKHVVSLMSLSNLVREQLQSNSTGELKSCIVWEERRCLYDFNCDFLVTRRIRNVERVFNTVISSLPQWQSLQSDETLPETGRSLSVRMSRASPPSGESLSESYRFDSMSGDPLPDWTDQVGPNYVALD